MLRRLVGEPAFFRGLRRFYGEMRFDVAGTDDLIRAFEAEAGRPLDDFFVRWIHEFDSACIALRLPHGSRGQTTPAPPTSCSASSRTTRFSRSR